MTLKLERLWMEEIDKFLQFLYKHIEDERIRVSKEIHYGMRSYHIDLILEQEVKNQNFSSFNELRITIDNENQCISMYNSYYDTTSTTIESKILVEKWSNIFEQYLENNIEDNVKKVINNTMSNIKDKDLLRDYQMEKIFNDNEPI